MRACGKVSISIIILFIILSFKLPVENVSEVDRSIDLFAKVFREVNSIYVEDIDPSSLAEAGIKAMLQSLDPYTSYISQEKLADFNSITSGEFRGVGVTIGSVNGRNVILSTLEGSSADRNGLKRGDEIIEIDGLTVTDKNEINNMIKNPEKEEISIKIRRFGQSDVLEKSLKVEKIKIKNVPYFGKIGDDVGYIKLVEFTSGAADEVRHAVMSLREQHVKKIILDLRGNPGGLLTEAVGVANVFLPKGSSILTIKGKSARWNKTYKGYKEPVDTSIPVVALTNDNSASAAEIVAGALQDYDRAVLVGQRTYGKGLVQATIPLGQNSKLKVTTAKFYIPSGRYIQSVGYSHIRKSAPTDTTYYTRNGREVKNGTGIMPDVPVKEKLKPDFVRELESKGFIFDFATHYYYNDPDANITARNFRLTDKEYASFLVWIEQQGFSYTSDLERAYNLLNSVVKSDNLRPQVAAEMEAIKSKLKLNRSAETDVCKDDIKALLEEEIVTRYAGKTEASIFNDEHVRSAINILSNTKKYHSLLGEPVYVNASAEHETH